MSVHISGTVTAPVADLARVEPTEAITLGSLVAGAQKTVNVGMFQNNGNVNQTVTLSEVVDAVDCTILGVYLNDQDGVNVGSSVALDAGKLAHAYAVVRANDVPAGSPDAECSFDLGWIWS